jgi:hypothetical protein
MAPRPKKRVIPAYERGREFKLRLPPDVSERIEAKAKAEGRPQNRIIINELAAYPMLERQRTFGQLIDEMEIVLARYGSRITLADLGEPVLRAVDEVLEAKTDAELQPKLDKLRVLRSTMLKLEQQAK